MEQTVSIINVFKINNLTVFDQFGYFTSDLDINPDLYPC